MLKHLLTILFAAALTSATAQSNNYKNYVVLHNKLWVLTADGRLKTFNTSTADSLPGAPVYPSPVVRLSGDAMGNLVIADAQNNVSRYNADTRKWQLLTQSITPYAVLYNSQNKGYIIGNKGITDVETNQAYLPDSTLNRQLRSRTAISPPSAYFMDSNDNIWLGFDYGEWGGDLIIFNTRSNKFVKPQLGSFNIELNPIQSFFEDGQSVYLSSGLQHMLNWGCIVRLTNFKAQVVYNSKDTLKKDRTHTYHGDSISRLTGGRFIGPATYNPADGCIYFYCQEGLFKGNPNTDLSKDDSWISLGQPTLTWQGGRSNAAGSPMAVLKLQFIAPGKLLMLSQNNGIIVYSDGVFTPLK